MTFSLALQGEDGFPGLKGEMGVKGDRVIILSDPESLCYYFTEDIILLANF